MSGLSLQHRRAPGLQLLKHAPGSYKFGPHSLFFMTPGCLKDSEESHSCPRGPQQGSGFLTTNPRVSVYGGLRTPRSPLCAGAGLAGAGLAPTPTYKQASAAVITTLPAHSSHLHIKDSLETRESRGDRGFVLSFPSS